MYIYISTIHRHMFCPSQELSVWLRLTSREQLMPPECSSSELSSIENFFSNLKLITYLKTGLNKTNKSKLIWLLGRGT